MAKSSNLDPGRFRNLSWANKKRITQSFEGREFARLRPGPWPWRSRCRDRWRNSHPLRGNPQNLRHLLVPEGPVVIAGQFTIFMWNLLFAQQCRELLIRANQQIFSAAIEIEIGQRCDARGGGAPRHVINIVCFPRL